MQGHFLCKDSFARYKILSLCFLKMLKSFFFTFSFCFLKMRLLYYLTIYVERTDASLILLLCKLSDNFFCRPWQFFSVGFRIGFLIPSRPFQFIDSNLLFPESFHCLSFTNSVCKLVLFYLVFFSASYHVFIQIYLSVDALQFSLCF